MHRFFPLQLLDRSESPRLVAYHFAPTFQSMEEKPIVQHSGFFNIKCANCTTDSMLTISEYSVVAIKTRLGEITMVLRVRKERKVLLNLYRAESIPELAGPFVLRSTSEIG